MVGTFRRALLEDEPRLLVDLAEMTVGFADTERLRAAIRDESLDQEEIVRLVNWMYSTDPTIAHVARAAGVSLANGDVRARVLEECVVRPDRCPFRIAFNAAENEYSVEVDGVPGWGISEFGAGEPINDRILAALHVLEQRRVD